MISSIICTTTYNRLVFIVHLLSHFVMNWHRLFDRGCWQASKQIRKQATTTKWIRAGSSILTFKQECCFSALFWVCGMPPPPHTKCWLPVVTLFSLILTVNVTLFLHKRMHRWSTHRRRKRGGGGGGAGGTVSPKHFGQIWAKLGENSDKFASLSFVLLVNFFSGITCRSSCILKYRTDFGRGEKKCTSPPRPPPPPPPAHRGFQRWRGFGQNGPKMCVPPKKY